ncbi:DUF4166 domain-containing protein [Brevibacterium sp. BRM-1]|uniref:DUF4166 domain-containing protein n=1 Tax=Brevibacterium sp. BRM-1 TaxID=2999062 RepID=UPI00227E9514|nr:DUF4166 domain-containing protein [Brevibacterium sp. BRM-1]WAL41121.1 DUF4166 domain-containing protein [Brevibacterium sp. BRM-1]
MTEEPTAGDRIPCEPGPTDGPTGQPSGGPTDGGVFRRALGADFDRLHPQLQRRFGVSVAAGYGCVGTGVMAELRRGPWWTVPFLSIGTLRNILFPERGRIVAFRIDNFPYIDGYGRETVSFVRTMEVRPGRRRRFDATMIYSAKRGGVVDYLGTHQHLAVDLELAVTDAGGLSLTSGEQRFYEGPVGFRFPMLASGFARLREHFDDERQVFAIDLEVRNRVFGFLFGYRGEFTCEYPAITTAPAPVKPYREERCE